jgi:hypothetical protein
MYVALDAAGIPSGRSVKVTLSNALPKTVFIVDKKWN